MAAILGAVTVGDDVCLSFNAQVEDDVPAGRYLASRVKFHAVEPAAANAASSDANMVRTGAPAFAQLRRLIAEDRRALERLCDGDPPASPLLAARLCAMLFRLSHHFQLHRRCRLAWCCWRLNVGLTGADIDPRSAIGSGLAIPHPVGISLHVTAGRNLTVRAFAGVGAETALAEDPWAVAGRPVLGKDVEICEHASVHGPVRVGDGARLGPGCKVMRDVAPGESLEAPAPRRMMVPMDEKSGASASVSSAGPAR
jgi:serine acetyltransferase